MSSLILGWEQEKGSGLGFVSAMRPRSVGSLVADPGDSHCLTIAGTGSGKGRSVAIPNLLHWDGPAIVLDIKGELATTTARYRRDVLGQEIVVLDPWGITDFEPASFNPLLRLADGPNLADDAYLLASQFSHPGGVLREPFWNERGQSLLAGLIAHIATDQKNPSRQLSRLYGMLSTDDTVFNNAQLLDEQGATMPSFAYQQISSILQTVEITRSGIISTAQSQVRVLAGELIKRATTETSFDLDKVTTGAPLTIYIVVPPANLISHAPLLRLWLSSLLSVITSRKTAPAKPTLLLLDEIAQLGPMDQVLSAITLTRSYGVRVALFLQSYSQLVALYPAQHQTILENCGTIITMGHSKRVTAAGVAAALGDISPEALYGMAREEAAVALPYQGTRIVRRLDYLDDPMFAGRADRNPLYANRRFVAGAALAR